MNLPDQLQPAVVHFPIALIVAGALLAVIEAVRSGNWISSSRAVATADGNNHVAIPTTEGRRFLHLREP